MAFLSFKAVLIVGLYYLIFHFVYQIIIPRIKTGIYYMLLPRAATRKTNKLLRLQPSGYG